MIRHPIASTSDPLGRLSGGLLNEALRCCTIRADNFHHHRGHGNTRWERIDPVSLVLVNNTRERSPPLYMTAQEIEGTAPSHFQIFPNYQVFPVWLFQPQLSVYQPAYSVAGWFYPK